MRDRQEADGGWGGIQPPWVWSIIMLAALGYGFEDDTLRRAVDGWSVFMIDDGDRLRPEACQSPTWDTALALLALQEAGVSPDDRRLRKAATWLLGEEIRVKGDWSIRRPDLEPSGWAFEFENDLYPDIDDTAVICLGLDKLGMGEDAKRRGLDWLVGMQSANGGWGAFDVDNSSYWLYKLPFCDFGYVIDPPSEDVTAHALEVLVERPAVRRRGRAGRRVHAQGAAGGRLLVGPLGREPRLRHRRRPARRSRPAGSSPATRRSAGRVAWLDSVQDAERRLRRGHPLLPRARLARPRHAARLPKRPGPY